MGVEGRERIVIGLGAHRFCVCEDGTDPTGNRPRFHEVFVEARTDTSMGFRGFFYSEQRSLGCVKGGLVGSADRHTHEILFEGEARGSKIFVGQVD